MPEKRRVKRLEALILEIVGPLVAHGLADPRLSLVTVTRVRLSPDLTVARINWSTLGDEADRTKAAHALEHARGRIQAAVAQALRTRVTPRLTFHYDESLARAQRLTDVLERLSRERAEREGPAPEAEGPAEEPGGGS